MNTNVQFLRAFRGPLFDSDAREKVLYGGSGSGKTHSAQQYAIIKAVKEPGAESLIIMETIAGVKTGMYYPMLKMLDDMSLSYISRETVPINIKLFNGHTLWFSSADNTEKLKHFTNVKRVIINEATALTEQDFSQLQNRMGRTYSDAEIVFTFNPIDAHHWLVERYVNPYLTGKVPKNTTIHHSTYNDNPFLSKEWVEWLKSMELQDANFYRVYALGEPGRLEGLVYIEGMNWVHKPLESFGFDIQKTPPVALGMDWGYNDPTVLIAFWDMPRGRYAHQFVYEPGMTPVDIVNRIASLIDASKWTKQIRIFCDPSRPENIELLNRAGLPNAQKAINDIQYGIGLVKDRPIIVSDESIDTIKELRNYRWKEKDGKTIDKPAEGYDHAMDALRYAIASSQSKPAADPNRFFVIGRKYGP